MKKKKKILSLLTVCVIGLGLVCGCGSQASKPAEAPAESTVESEETAASEEESEEAVSEEVVSEETEENTLTKTEGCDLEDGVYTAEFNTDSGMFHVNEACEGKGTLTVKDGLATIHVSLVSKNIVNLYLGLADDAEKDGAVLIDPTTDEVTYSDGLSDEVYGFDIPVPVFDEEFDLAIIGKKGTWYDHKVSVTNVTAE